MLDLVQECLIETNLQMLLGLDEGQWYDDLKGKLLTVEKASTDPTLRRKAMSQVLEQLSALLRTYTSLEKLGSRAEASLARQLCRQVQEDQSGDDGAYLLDEIVNMLKAAFTSTANSLTWLVECLVGSSDHISLIREEYNSILLNPLFTQANILSLKHTVSCVYESLRLRPLAPFNGLRRVPKDMIVAGYLFKQGQILAPCGLNIHLSSTIYEEPSRFLPSRWSNQRPHPQKWIPFGGGSRRCLGDKFAIAQMMIFIGSLLSQFDVQLQKPALPPQWQHSFTSPQYGLVVSLKPSVVSRPLTAARHMAQ